MKIHNSINFCTNSIISLFINDAVSSIVHTCHVCYILWSIVNGEHNSMTLVLSIGPGHMLFFYIDLNSFGSLPKEVQQHH
jgi:hypothetical protein